MHFTSLRSWVAALGRDCNAGLWDPLCPKGSRQRRVKQHLPHVLTGLFLIDFATGKSRKGEAGLRAQFLRPAHVS